MFLADFERYVIMMGSDNTSTVNRRSEPEVVVIPSPGMKHCSKQLEREEECVVAIDLGS